MKNPDVDGSSRERALGFPANPPSASHRCPRGTRDADSFPRYNIAPTQPIDARRLHNVRRFRSLLLTSRPLAHDKNGGSREHEMQRWLLATVKTSDYWGSLWLSEFPPPPATSMSELELG